VVSSFSEVGGVVGRRELRKRFNRDEAFELREGATIDNLESFDSGSGSIPARSVENRRSNFPNVVIDIFSSLFWILG